MADFQACFEYVLGHEGGYSNNPHDQGGTTNFGVSLRFLREVPEDRLKRVGIFGEVTEKTIEELTRDQAQKLYFSEFWQNAPFEKLQNGVLAKYIFDMSIHHGMAQATRLTQRACCAAQKQRDYVKDDAIFGAKTIQAVNQASFMLLPALIATRAGFMRQLVAVNGKLEVFLDGWLNRCYDI